MSEEVVAVDIGGTATKVASVSRAGEVTGWRSFPTEPPLASYREQLAQAVREVGSTAQGRLLGTACAMAGFVDEQATLLYNGNLRWLEGQSLAECLRLQPGWPLVVESDSNAACAGESVFGVGAGIERLLCLTVGTGVGMGMMVDGSLVRTAYGCLGDAGHVIVSPEGPLCTCGGRGCAEAVVSTVALGQQYGNGGFRALVADVAAGQQAALLLAAEAGTALGIAIASVANLFAPGCVAIAGGLAHLGEPLRHAADLSFRRHAGDFITQNARVVLAHTGSQASLLGAAACFFAERGRIAGLEVS